VDTDFRSAIVVPVPGAAGAADEWRERKGVAETSAPMPPHITLLYPFCPAARLDEVVAPLLAVFAGTVPFSFELRELGRFPGTLYLAPRPDLPFVRLTEKIVEHFPEHPPYEGVFDSIVPHVTVAQGDDPVLQAATAVVETHLPIFGEALEAQLLEEIEHDWRRWRVHTRLPFGGAAPRDAGGTLA